jgi:hypothetical protein
MRTVMLCMFVMALLSIGCCMAVQQLSPGKTCYNQTYQAYQPGKTTMSHVVIHNTKKRNSISDYLSYVRQETGRRPCCIFGAILFSIAISMVVSCGVLVKVS